MANTATRTQPSHRRIPTSPERRPLARLRRERWIRRLVVALMFGSKTEGVTATGGGYTLSVVYARVTRPGLPVRWEYTIRHPGGFQGKIDVATTFEYLNLFDVTNIQPSPSEETANRDVIVWSFDPPPGDVFSVTFDAATEVGVHVLPRATASVLVDGRPAVQVRFRTVVVP
jgi:hypothetical protein